MNRFYPLSKLSVNERIGSNQVTRKLVPSRRPPYLTNLSVSATLRDLAAVGCRDSLEEGLWEKGKITFDPTITRGRILKDAASFQQPLGCRVVMLRKPEYGRIDPLAAAAGAGARLGESPPLLEPEPALLAFGRLDHEPLP